MRPQDLARLLDKLEQHYGPVRFTEPTDPYELIVYTNCGYPSSQENCRRGFDALKSSVGISTAAILGASGRQLATALKAGGIVAELRASRLKLIARLVSVDFGGALRSVLDASKAARKALKRFPTIGDPGADKILLFCAEVPVAAVPSNCHQVLLRLGLGMERASYAASYRSAQEALAQLLPRQAAPLKRAYLLLRHHGQELCRRSTPLCDRCPVAPRCPYFGSHGGAAPRKVRAAAALSR